MFAKKSKYLPTELFLGRAVLRHDLLLVSGIVPTSLPILTFKYLTHSP